MTLLHKCSALAKENPVFVKSFLEKVKSSLDTLSQQKLANEVSSIDGDTPLMEAIDSGASAEVVRLILGLRGNINLKNLLGQRALHYAARFCSHFS